MIGDSGTFVLFFQCLFDPAAISRQQTILPCMAPGAFPSLQMTGIFFLLDTGAPYLYIRPFLKGSVYVAGTVQSRAGKA